MIEMNGIELSLTYIRARDFERIEIFPGFV